MSAVEWSEDTKHLVLMQQKAGKDAVVITAVNATFATGPDPHDVALGALGHDSGASPIINSRYVISPSVCKAITVAH